MDYYAIQVKTKAEDQFIQLLNKIFLSKQLDETLYFPKRKLQITKKGIKTQQIQPIFSSYVFLETKDFSDELYWMLRTSPGFYRFLPNNNQPTQLLGRDLATLKHFISFGSIADTSKVSFDEQDRIIVSEGPLKGLEGKIVKVDKRKGRAKVKLDLYEESFLVDLAFELMGTT